jgi:hypothetical protein
MATRSSISVKLPDGKCRTIYCHWDGSPEHNGNILNQHYRDLDKINKLIDLGDISSLGRFVSPEEATGVDDKTHSYDNPMKDVTVAYHRDRGEEKNEARIYNCASDINEDSQYDYLFVDGAWTIL